MSSLTTAPATQVARTEQRSRRRKTALISLALIAAVLCIAVGLFIRFWPFDQRSVLQALQEASDSQVQARAFHTSFFPDPECTLDNVVFTRGNAAQPLITIEKLTIQGSYLGILARRVSRVTAEGMRIVIPPFGTGQTFHTKPSTITIGEIVANGTTLEFLASNAENQPLRFDIPQASLRDVGWSGALAYNVKVQNPQPPGEVSAKGKFGVWNQNDPSQTPVSGEYTFEHADLSVYDGIAGTLSSAGKFGGNLGHIDISGTTDTPDFEVTSGKHPVPLKTEFTAYVDAIHGDTFLKRVDARFRKTQIVASGSIAKSATGSDKTALIDVSDNNGRIEDLIGLFVEKDRPPMSGAITLRAKVEIPPGDRAFLKRIKLAGSFGIGGGKFAKTSTQENVDKLSAGARGEKGSSDPETALTDLTGQVVLGNGVANLADLAFGVPGARAQLHGTYDLVNYKIDLRGQLWVDSKISNTSTGTRALLLKMMDPFFKKRKKGETLPVRLSGTYQKPSFGLDLDDKKAKQVAPGLNSPGH
jgi:AsmA-like C-terminal region